MEWSRRDDQEICSECLQEAINKNIPALKRSKVVESYPCSRHGHPGILSSRLRAWVDFFNYVAPYSTSQTLDHSLISKICQEYGISFVEAFEKLTIILKVLGKHDKRHQQVNPEHEEEKPGV